jgi:hypothetical protein
MNTTLENFLKSKNHNISELRYYVPDDMQKLFGLPKHLDLNCLFLLSSVINPELVFTNEMKEYLGLDERFNIFIGSCMCDIDGIKYWTKIVTPFKTETLAHSCQSSNKIFKHFIEVTDNMILAQKKYRLFHPFSYWCKDEECQRWSDLQKELVDKFMSLLVLPTFSNSKWKVQPPFDNVFVTNYKSYIVYEDYENYDSDYGDNEYAVIADFDTFDEANVFVCKVYETIYSTNSQDENYFIKTVRKLHPKLLSREEFNSWNFPIYFISVNHAKIKNEELKM